jgi:phosphatidylinositol glycan class N
MVCHRFILLCTATVLIDTELKKTHTLVYKPFTQLESGSLPRRLQELERIQTLINTSKWHEAREASYTLIQDSLLGLHYLHTYDRTLLRIIVTFAYTGWMLYASLYIMRPLDGRPSTLVESNTGAFVPMAVAMICWGVFLWQRSPWSYYLYIAFPAYFWRNFLREGVPYLLLPKVKTRFIEGLKQNLLSIALAIVVLLTIAVCRSFTCGM